MKLSEINSRKKLEKIQKELVEDDFICKLPTHKNSSLREKIQDLRRENNRQLNDLRRERRNFELDIIRRKRQSTSCFPSLSNPPQNSSNNSTKKHNSIQKFCCIKCSKTFISAQLFLIHESSCLDTNDISSNLLPNKQNISRKSNRKINKNINNNSTSPVSTSYSYSSDSDDSSTKSNSKNVHTASFPQTYVNNKGTTNFEEHTKNYFDKFENDANEWKKASVPLNNFFMRSFGPWSMGTAEERAEEKRLQEEQENIEREIKRKKADQIEELYNQTQMKLYQIKWSEFTKNNSKQSIQYEDIPWIPTLTKKTANGLESFALLGVSDEASIEEKKQAVRRASLRWHPDKFIQAHGKYLLPQDLDRIMDGVNKMAQRINEFRTRIEESN